MEVWFYFREAQIGDAVYSDGTYSDIPNLMKKQIGVCYYIDPKDNSHRLMVGFEDAGNAEWGLSSSSFSSVTLEVDPSYNVFDTPLPNFAAASKGTTSDVNASSTQLLDPSQPDGFKVWPSSNAESQVGYMQTPVDLTYKDKSFPAGSYVPVAMRDMITILNHRDKILKDPAVNKEVPMASKEWTEAERLNYLLDKITTENGNNANYRQYYYPSFSVTHAYEPKMPDGVELADRFKAGQWLVPAIGDLARIAWYNNQKNAVDTSKAIFLKWISLGTFNDFSNQLYTASTEQTNSGRWYVGVYNGNYGNTGKATSGLIRPICAF